MTYDEIKNTLLAIDDAALRLEMVMDIGNQMESVPSGAVCNEIVGCASHVEICRCGNQFFGIADSAVVRGIVAIIISMVNGKSPDEIKQMDLIGMFNALNINIGAGRLNGVNSMIRFLQNL